MLSEKAVSSYLSDIKNGKSTTNELILAFLQAAQPLFALRNEDGSLYSCSGELPGLGYSGFLPVFSHKRLATASAFSAEVPDTCGYVVYQHAEPLRLARIALLSGLVFVLNPGENQIILEPWAILSCAEDYLLQISADEDLPVTDPEHIDPALADYFELVRLLRNNSHSRLGVVSDAAMGERSYTEIRTGDDVRPITLSELNQLSGNILVSTPKLSGVLSTHTLQNVLRLTSVSEPVAAIAPTATFIDEPSPAIMDEYVRTAALPRLDFTAAVAGEDQTGSVGSEPDHDEPPEFDSGVSFNFSEEEAPAIDVTKDQPFYREKAVEHLKKIYPSDDESRTKRTNKKLLFLAIVPFLLFVAILAFVFTHQMKQESYNRFVRNIDKGDYATAMAIYQAETSRKKYDDFVSETVATTMSGYAEGSIAEAVAQDAFAELVKYPNQKPTAEQTLNEFQSLADSKAAYASGSMAEDKGDKLKAFALVIPADTQNYSAVMSFVSENSEENLAYVVDKLEHATVTDRNEMVSLVNSFFVLYPDRSEAVAQALEQYLSICDSLGEIPVQITELSFRHEAEDDSITLLIKWSNLSGRTIRYIDYYFSFLDEVGNPVFRADREGQTKSVYMGREQIGPYAAGFATPEDVDHGWTGVWSGSGSKICSVSLAGVELRYDDGDEEFVAITNLQALTNIWQGNG